MNAVPEKEYFAQQTSSAAPLEYLGIFVSIVMGVGSAFAAMNTMYAAVARRSREIGTLRVLGFSKVSILTSFVVESLLLASIGGILGCLLVLPVNGLTTSIGSNFSELAFAFRVTPAIMVGGVIFAAVLGGIGGLFPASTAARKDILAALRQV
jgi:putative ABC transport system permease protein